MQVVNAAGASVLTSADTYTYAAPPLSAITLNPASATITAGGTTTFTVTGTASDGTSLGDITGQTTFTIAGSAGQAGASCTGATCTATLAGSYTVTGTDNGITATATITVAPAAIASLTPSAGDAQSAAEGAEFATPLAVTAVDTYGNPVPGAAVTFTVSSGSAPADPGTVINAGGRPSLHQIRCQLHHLPHTPSRRLESRVGSI